MGAGKKVVAPAAMRQVAEEMQEHFKLSERRACKAIGVSRSQIRYQAKDRADGIILSEIRAILVKKPRYGCPRVQLMLRRSGWHINHKRTERIYYGHGLLKFVRPSEREDGRYRNYRGQMDLVKSGHWTSSMTILPTADQSGF